MASPSNFLVTPFGGLIQNTEINFRSLYLRQIFSGPDQNQALVVAGDGATGLGETAGNNWEIYDGVGPEAQVVARAQGQHMRVGSWFNSFAIVFENERFKGSTLQVMGATFDNEGEWAIVGGTGDFAMACGNIGRKVHEHIGNGEIQELTIRGFCKMQRPAPKRFGPWGASAGPDLQPQMLESIEITSGGAVDSFLYTYIDQAGQRRTGGRWGKGGGPTRQVITLGNSERLKQMSGTFRDYYGEMTITSLKFVTTSTTYGPFGIPEGTSFQVPVPQGESIVGFFGKSGPNYLTSIGVYTM